MKMKLAVQTAAPLAGYFPASPMLYVEVRDFSALLKDWCASELRRSSITPNLEQVRPVRPRL
jgi:hypothetical protein